MRYFRRIIALTGATLLFAMLLAGHRVQAASTDANVIGKPGVERDVSRDIYLTQLDNMFLPNEIWVTEGETIRFIIRNKGDRQHEWVIGTMKDLRRAAKMRRNHPDEVPQEPGTLRLQPEEQGEIVWTFDKAGEIDFACPLPGHFKGMQGKIYVEKK